MAIFSLHVRSMGKATQAPGTAGAHLRYITRDTACSHVDGEHMPLDPNEARAWMDGQEKADRKNARLFDKIMIALPRELSDTQRAELVRAYCRELTGGQVPWLAAIHQTGKDAQNPHAHIVIRDRHHETGKRVLRWSDSPRDRAKLGLVPNVAEHIRERWETCANLALERAGHEARIDRRSLEAQGIDREPTIHIGPQAQHVDSFVSRPESKPAPQRKRRLANSGFEGCEQADYVKIDAGRTRKERHAEIIDLNLERQARSPDFETRERAKFLRDQIRRDQVLERELVADARTRTLAERRQRAKYQNMIRDARIAWKGEEGEAAAYARGLWKEQRTGLKERHDGERATLKADQSRLSQKVLRFIDVTGGTKRKHNAAKKALQSRHRDERRDLVVKYAKARQSLSQAVRGRHEPIVAALKAEYRAQRGQLRDMHELHEQIADQRRQLRASERAREERQFEETLRLIQEQQRQRSTQQRTAGQSRDQGPSPARPDRNAEDRRNMFQRAAEGHPQPEKPEREPDGRVRPSRARQSRARLHRHIQRGGRGKGRTPDR